MATRPTKKLQDIDTKGYTAAAKRLVEEIQSLDVIPPKDGEFYSLKRKRYSVGDGSVVMNELQFNLATILATDPDIPYWKAYAKAGYEVASYFNEAKNVKRIQAHLTGRCNSAITPPMQKLINYLKYGAAEELKIDATWLLNEQVNLYEECKRNKMYTQAVRLLNDISYHVDVDSRVSNKIEIEQKVDYAALLQEADSRISPPTLPDKETSREGALLEGNYEEISH